MRFEGKVRPTISTFVFSRPYFELAGCDSYSIRILHVVCDNG